MSISPIKVEHYKQENYYQMGKEISTFGGIEIEKKV